MKLIVSVSTIKSFLLGVILVFATLVAGAQTVTVDAAHVANTFSPVRSLGAAIDRLRTGTPEHLLTDPLLHEILGAGWQTVTYRQNTELMVEAWHWNPNGKWSNGEKQEGYFVGNAEPTSEKIVHGWAAPLPHRGFSRGDGNGWSRLTDGDLKSYWKSNPYLTKAFTGEDDSVHPQWVMIDLGTKIDVNAIRIAWADPYAKKYTVQFWTGELEPFYEGTTKGTWQTFPLGNISEGKGGTVTLKLVSWMINVRYLRILMTESSNTCDSHGSNDKRNCVGYAINELYVGSLSRDGVFNDYVTHFPSRAQTVTWPSSVDPWHAATDMDESRGDQVGFDFFFTSGITRGLPTMVPIAMLYSTPEDAANEIAYLYKRKYPISWVEMGEEADGQHMLPEDYAALYLQFATAIHKVVPEAKLGGPPFEGTFGDVEVWPDASGNVSWLGRFFNYLKTHGRMNDFTFFSFEHYPYQDRPSYSWADLYPEPDYVKHIVQVWKDDGLPPGIPFFMTEGNIGGGAPASTIKSGLWLADYVGSMMAEGAGATYYFHYMPYPREFSGFGNFLWIDQNYKVTGYPPQYIAAQMITKEWVQPIDAPHKQFKASSDITDAAGNVLVTAYVVERPDGQWSVMLVNRDQSNDHAVKLVFNNGNAAQHFVGQVDRITFGSNEYAWHADGNHGHADPDGPASRSQVSGGADAIYQIPKASITVLRGKLEK
ncbi:MAG: discoidin domain-containing protein [Candidatus Sulfotelmatobacter sp.]